MPPALGDRSCCGYNFKALTRGETRIPLLYRQGVEMGFAESTMLEIVEMPVTIR
jgi:hypothetical protein